MNEQRVESNHFGTRDDFLFLTIDDITWMREDISGVWFNLYNKKLSLRLCPTSYLPPLPCL